MSFGKRSVPGRGIGGRNGNAPDDGAPRRLPTYAELSQPGPDEVAEAAGPMITNKKAYVVAQMKWGLIIKGGVLAVVIIAYTAGRLLFGGISSGFEEAGRELGREMQKLAASCNDPAARARLEREGWTVHVNPEGGCRITR